jgi:hypothetical protein
MIKNFALVALSSIVAAKDAHKSFQQIALENGYAVESYSVVTSDGYVSQIYRIPGTI